MSNYATSSITIMALYRYINRSIGWGTTAQQFRIWTSSGIFLFEANCVKKSIKINRYILGFALFYWFFKMQKTMFNGDMEKLG